MKTQAAPLMANTRPRIAVNKCIVIKRSLIGPGVLNVTKGIEITPYDILGKSNQSSGYSSIRLSKQLGVSASDGVKFLQKPIGSTIFKGELLALKKGIFSKKNILSPTDGIIDHFDPQSGELRLKFLGKQMPLTAGVFGIVEDVNPKEGVVLIKTLATLVYGVIGFGSLRGGILEFVGNQTDPVYSTQITPSMHQHIVVAGAIIFKDALKKAAGFGIQGVISGGFNLSDYRAMMGSLDIEQRLETDVGITVLAAEGFGPIPMDPDVFKLLKSYESKFILMNGDKKQAVLPADSADSILSLRKISLPQNTQQLISPEVSLGELSVGSKVRLIWTPLMGAQGKVIALDNTPTLLESGLSTYLLTVETASRKIKVPFTNVELVD